jgi:hypothetical protein
MFSLLPTILLAAAASAELTTTIWIPAYASEEPSSTTLKGSIVSVDGDRVTMKLEDDTETSLLGPNTFTFIGSTAFEAVQTTSMWQSNDYTLSHGCSLASDGEPVCKYSMNGPAAWTLLCSPDVELGNQRKRSAKTKINDSFDQVPEFCSEKASTIPEMYAVVVESSRGIGTQTQEIIITAGEEKLSATAGATPKNSAASPTPTGEAASLPKSSTSGPSVAQQTDNAAPMATLAPSFMGLAAFVAAMAL